MFYSKHKLDEIVLNIEFLLISVVQAAALTSLAIPAAIPLSEMDYQYFPYILSGFFFILIFWSQAIIHALSFIDWPLDLLHGFLYFLASFIEVITFSQIKNPLAWFGFSVIFFIVAGFLYIVDLRLIVKRKNNFQHDPREKKLFIHIFGRQRFELVVLLPLGLLFNICCFIILFIYPAFTHSWQHIIFALFQSIFSFFLLWNSIINFKQRIKLINECIKNK